MLKLLSLTLRVILGLVILGFGVGLIAYMVSTKPKPKLKPEVFAPMLVQGMILAPQPIERSWSGYGTARALTSARVAPQVSALVVSRSDWLEPGARVQAGQTLFELQRVDFELAAQSARDTIASLEAQRKGLDIEEQRLVRQMELSEEEEAIAQRDLERAREAIGLGAGAEPELDQWTATLRRAQRASIALSQQVDLIPTRRDDLKARIEAQKTQLRQAEENLARTTINAPIDGVIQAVSLDAGEWAQAGQAAATIVNLARIEVPLRVSIEASGLIAVGDRAEVRGRLEDSEFWPGTVSRVAPDADPNTRAMTIYIEVRQDPDTDRVLRPGRFVIGRIFESQPAPRIVVPRRAIKGGRILVASEPDGTVARVWPLAERIAGTIATQISLGSTTVVSDGKGGAVPQVVLDAARLELDDRASEIADAVTASTNNWLKGNGEVRLREEIQRALKTTLTPQIASWLANTSHASLPPQLADELETVLDLASVTAVPVETLFTVERTIPALSDRENQWVVVEARDKRDLAHLTLLISNLDQLSDGMLVQVNIANENNQ